MSTENRNIGGFVKCQHGGSPELVELSSLSAQRGSTSIIKVNIVTIQSKYHTKMLGKSLPTLFSTQCSFRLYSLSADLTLDVSGMRLRGDASAIQMSVVLCCQDK